MIHYLYAFHSKAEETYICNKPEVILPADFKEMAQKALKKAVKEGKETGHEVVLLLVGLFDTNTGLISPQNEILLDYEEYIESIKEDIKNDK